jgi:hypothetical protein
MLWPFASTIHPIPIPAAPAVFFFLISILAIMHSITAPWIMSGLLTSFDPFGITDEYVIMLYLSIPADFKAEWYDPA